MGCGCSKNDKILCSFVSINRVKHDEYRKIKIITLRLKDPSWKCEGNGFVYDIEKIWNLKGKNIPERVRNIVKVLYQSYDFKDKYIALMATYSLLDLPNRITQEFNPLTFFEVCFVI